MIRSFLAFELPTDIKKIVAQVSKEIRQLTLNVRWVDVENIHLTIVFMGNINEQEIPHVSQAIALQIEAAIIGGKIQPC